MIKNGLQSYLNHIQINIQRAVKMVEEKIREIREKEGGITDVPSLFLDRFIRLLEQLGIKISNKGAQSLAWSLIIGWLLWSSTALPEGLGAKLKLYFLPIGLFGYFVLELLLNIERLNRIAKKMSSGTKYAFQNVMNNIVDEDELEIYLATVSFKPEQFRDIIAHLRKINRFSVKAQWNLMTNKKLYGPIIPEIEKSLLTDNDWYTPAVCKFLEMRAGNLSEKYINDLTKKYNSPSIVFNVGAYHNYQSKFDDINEKYFLAGFEFNSVNLFSKLYRLVLFSLAMVSLGAMMYGFFKLDSLIIYEQQKAPVYLVAGTMTLMFIMTVVPIYPKVITKLEIKRALSKHEIKLTPIQLNALYYDIR